MKSLWFTAALLAVPLLAQPIGPTGHIAGGFKALSSGEWHDAFNEWEKQCLPLGEEELSLRKNLDKWVPKTWSIGAYEMVRRTRLTSAWQRQWWFASFDQGVVFFVFDYVLHKGEWRLFRVEGSRDPKDLMLGLDLVPQEKEALATNPDER